MNNRFFCILMIMIFGLTATPISSAQSTEPIGVEQEPAAKFFTDMPISVLEFINKSRRLDMLDYYATDSIHKVPNGMEGFSYLEKVTPNYLKAQITPQSSLEISVIPIKGDTIYQCIYTISTQDQANDSEIKFYTQDYTQLATSKYIKLPELRNFINLDSAKKDERKDIERKIEELLPFTTVALSTDPVSHKLKAQLTSSQLCPQFEYDKISKYIRPTITYDWTGSKYSQAK